MRNYNNRNELYIKLLLETPHGFAIFSLLKPVCLLDEHKDENETLKYLWTNFVSDSTANSIVQSRDDYERLDDKSLAIDVVTGHVDKHLGNKLKTLCMHGKTLAVGTPQQATIIQSQLGIRCLHNDVVMELMWGLKFLLEYFVPEEKESGLTGEHKIHMSKGLDMLLRRHGFHHVQPNMVTKRVVNLALALFNCEYDANFYSCHSSYLTNLLMEVSDIDCRDWDHLKRATAFKMICLPRERKHLLAQQHMMFTPDEASRLQAAQPAQYDGRMNVPVILYLYKTALSLMRARRDLGDSLGISTEKPFG